MLTIWHMIWASAVPLGTGMLALGEAAAAGQDSGMGRWGKIALASLLLIGALAGANNVGFDMGQIVGSHSR